MESVILLVAVAMAYVVLARVFAQLCKCKVSLSAHAQLIPKMTIKTGPAKTGSARSLDKAMHACQLASSVLVFNYQSVILFKVGTIFI